MTSQTGATLLLVVGEPFSAEQKELILQRIAKGVRSLDDTLAGCDVNQALSGIAEEGLVGEEGPNGERTVQCVSEGLSVQILFNPQLATLQSQLRTFLTSGAKHCHLVYGGQVIHGTGSWVLQDDLFHFNSFATIVKETDVENSLKQQQEARLHIHAFEQGEWSQSNFNKLFSNSVTVEFNPEEKLAQKEGLEDLTSYLGTLINVKTAKDLLLSSDVVGNIRFNRPTLYVFPGCNGDSALFGINGFNLLVNGGYNRKACFWDFTRHLDRIDAMLVTHLGADNLFGVSTVLDRKAQDNVHPEIGYVYMNGVGRKKHSPNGDTHPENGAVHKPASLSVNLAEEGHRIIENLHLLGQTPGTCLGAMVGKELKPVNLYHKVGHGTLDMYILNPMQDSKEMKEFFAQWNKNVNCFPAKGGFPLPNMMSVCALLVWRPANQKEKITRILFPGNAPQAKIFEGLDKLKTLDIFQHDTCSELFLKAPKPQRKGPAGKPMSAPPGKPASAQAKRTPPPATPRAEPKKASPPPSEKKGPAGRIAHQSKTVKDAKNKKAGSSHVEGSKSSKSSTPTSAEGKSPVEPTKPIISGPIPDAHVDDVPEIKSEISKPVERPADVPAMPSPAWPEPKPEGTEPVEVSAAERLEDEAEDPPKLVSLPTTETSPPSQMEDKQDLPSPLIEDPVPVPEPELPEATPMAEENIPERKDQPAADPGTGAAGSDDAKPLIELDATPVTEATEELQAPPETAMEVNESESVKPDQVPALNEAPQPNEMPEALPDPVEDDMFAHSHMEVPSRDQLPDTHDSPKSVLESNRTDFAESKELEPMLEPKPDQEPEAVVNQEEELMPEQEPEPVLEPVLEPESAAKSQSEFEPEAVDNQEPELILKQEPEPVVGQEPIGEQMQDSMPRHEEEQEQEKKANLELMPEQEPEPEPALEPVLEPESAAKSQSEFEPEAVVNQEPELILKQEPEPVVGQEPIGEQMQDSMPRREEEQEQEKKANLDLMHQQDTKPALESEPVVDQAPEPMVGLEPMTETEPRAYTSPDLESVSIEGQEQEPEEVMKPEPELIPEPELEQESIADARAEAVADPEREPQEPSLGLLSEQEGNDVSEPESLVRQEVETKPMEEPTSKKEYGLVQEDEDPECAEAKQMIDPEQKSMEVPEPLPDPNQFDSATFEALAQSQDISKDLAECMIENDETSSVEPSHPPLDMTPHTSDTYHSEQDQIIEIGNVESDSSSLPSQTEICTSELDQSPLEPTCGTLDAEDQTPSRTMPEEMEQEQPESRKQMEEFGIYDEEIKAPEVDSQAMNERTMSPVDKEDTTSVEENIGYGSESGVNSAKQTEPSLEELGIYDSEPVSSAVPGEPMAEHEPAAVDQGNRGTSELGAAEKEAIEDVLHSKEYAAQDTEEHSHYSPVDLDGEASREFHDLEHEADIDEDSLIEVSDPTRPYVQPDLLAGALRGDPPQFDPNSNPFELADETQGLPPLDCGNTTNPFLGMLESDSGFQPLHQHMNIPKSNGHMEDPLEQQPFPSTTTAEVDHSESVACPASGHEVERDSLEREEPDRLSFDPVKEWGEPMGLPAPDDGSPKKAKRADGTTKSEGAKASGKGPSSATAGKKAPAAAAGTKKSPAPDARKNAPPRATPAARKPASAGASGRGALDKTMTEQTKKPASTSRKPPSGGRPSSVPASKAEPRAASGTAAKRSSVGNAKATPAPKVAPTKPVTPFYVDLTYVPNHGDSNYIDIDFFRRVRARYYVISALCPNPALLNAFLDAKETWENADAEVTIIPTYDTELLRHWMALHREKLSQLKVDVAPSASRCTIQLQDHETSCAAYRLEF